MICTNFELSSVCLKCGHYYVTKNNYVLNIAIDLGLIVPETTSCPRCRGGPTEITSLSAKTIGYVEKTDVSEKDERVIVWKCPQCSAVSESKHHIDSKQRIKLIRRIRQDKVCQICNTQLSLIGFHTE